MCCRVFFHFLGISCFFVSPPEEVVRVTACSGMIFMLLVLWLHFFPKMIVIVFALGPCSCVHGTSCIVVGPFIVLAFSCDLCHWVGWLGHFFCVCFAHTWCGLSTVYSTGSGGRFWEAVITDIVYFL